MQWDQPVPQRDPPQNSGRYRRTAGGNSVPSGLRVPKELGGDLAGGLKGTGWGWEGAGTTPKPQSYRSAPPGSHILAAYQGALGSGDGRRLTCYPPLPSKGRRELCSDSTNCGRDREVRGSEWTTGDRGRPGGATELHRPARPTW